MFLSLRRYDPDQVRRVAAPSMAVEPAASQPPAGAPLGRRDYPQTARRPSRFHGAGPQLIGRRYEIVQCVISAALKHAAVDLHTEPRPQRMHSRLVKGLLMYSYGVRPFAINAHITIIVATTSA